VEINEILARYIRQVVRALLDRFGRRLFIVTRPLAGRLSDGYSETAVIILALMVTIAALIALSLSTGLWGLLGSAALYGIGFGSAHPVLHAATIRLAGAERIGAANATFTTAVDLGIGLGAIVLGWIVQYTSYRGLFMVSAASVAVCPLVFTLVKHMLAEGFFPLKQRTPPDDSAYYASTKGV